MLRSIVDAIEDRAVNTRNASISVVVSVASGVALASLGLGGLGLALGAAAGLLVLGATTVLFLHGRYPIRWDRLHIGTTVVLNGAALLGGILLRSWAKSAHDGPVLLALGGCAEVLLAAAYLAALLQIKVGWLQRLLQSLLRR
jgi:hypothetical protein